MSKRAASEPIIGSASQLAKKQKVHDAKDDSSIDFITPNVQATALAPVVSTPKRPAPADPTKQSAPPSKKRKTGSIADSATPSSKRQVMNKGSTKKPPVAQGFSPWKPTITVPPQSQFWGIKPVSGDPLPHPNQPSARTSDAATNPPAWEDRKFRFKRGSRYVKYFGSIEPEDSQSMPDLDQEDLLVLKLIDMRPKSKKDQTPRRTPTYYAYEHGKPKDWNNMQSVKALNDRRAQAIERITVDAPWSRVEREYLVEICRTYPDASIWEMTMRFNDRFKGQDFAASTAFSFTPKSTGRTVESVRHEYMTYKLAYDKGEAPQGVRYRTDSSPEGKALRASGKMEAVFGTPCAALEKKWDEEQEKEGADEDVEEENMTPKLPVVPMARQPKLVDADEELLELAGAYDNGEMPPSPVEPLLAEILATPDSPMSDINDEEFQGLTAACNLASSVTIGEMMKADANELINQSAESVEVQKPIQATTKALSITEEIVLTRETRAPSLTRAARNIEINEEYDDDSDEV